MSMSFQTYGVSTRYRCSSVEMSLSCDGYGGCSAAMPMVEAGFWQESTPEEVQGKARAFYRPKSSAQDEIEKQLLDRKLWLLYFVDVLV